MAKTIPLPPPLLAHESYPELNRTFYGIEPHDYFDVRLALLMVLAGKPGVVRDAIREGLEYQGLRAGRRPADDGEPVEDDTEDDEEKQAKEFVISESVGLLHHVSETLLRFYLAHVGLPPCPWLEIAEERNPEGFKKKVSARFDGHPLDSDRRAEIAQVFYGQALPSGDGPPADVWDASLENIEQWLTHFATWFVAEAHLFNAVKHGLAVQPGEASMELITPADETRGDRRPLIHASGPSIGFLERSGDPAQWHYTTRWVEPDRLMGETYIAMTLLGYVWRVGRLRYTDLGERERIGLLDRPKYNEYMDSLLEPGEGARIITNRMSRLLAHRWAYPPDEITCVSCGRKPAKSEAAHKTWRGLVVEHRLETYCPECAARTD